MDLFISVERLNTPIDPQGRDVRWFEILSNGSFFYEQSLYETPIAFLKHLKASYDLVTSRGYTIPVLVEHNKNGERRGDVVAVELVEENQIVKLVAALAIKDLNSKIESGEIKFVSVGINSISLDTGDVLQNAITEISIVSSPHRKNIDTHVILKENGGMMLSPEDKNALLDTLKSELKLLYEADKAMRMAEEEEAKKAEEVADPEMEDEEPKEEEPKVEIELSEKVKDLEKQVREAKLDAFKSKYPSVIELGETAIESLYDLSLKDEAGFKKLIKNKKVDLNPIGSNTINLSESMLKDPKLAWEAIKAKHNGNLTEANKEWNLVRSKFASK
jgi:hypothetical protein